MMESFLLPSDIIMCEVLHLPFMSCSQTQKKNVMPLCRTLPLPKSEFLTPSCQDPALLSSASSGKGPLP